MGMSTCSMFMTRKLSKATAAVSLCSDVDSQQYKGQYSSKGHQHFLQGSSRVASRISHQLNITSQVRSCWSETYLGRKPVKRWKLSSALCLISSGELLELKRKEGGHAGRRRLRHQEEEEEDEGLWRRFMSLPPPPPAVPPLPPPPMKTSRAVGA